MRLVSRRLGIVLALTASAAAGACADKKSDEAPAHPKEAAPTPTQAPTLTSDARDAAAKAAKPEPKPYDGPYLGALFLQTPVMSEMEWPKDEDKRKPGDKSGSVRLGYIRQGAKVPVIAEAHPKSNCKEGWYELVQGGFVCGKYASLDANHPRMKTAPHLPDMTGMLPYQYGYNVGNGTPLYRTIPSREERLALEPWLAPKPAKKKKSDDADSDTASDSPASSILTRTSQVVPQPSSDPLGLGTDALDAGTPWYLRDYDGGKPQVTLDDLKGDGPVARRMVKGFFLSLDKDFSANGAHWWKNVGGLMAPYERIFVYKNASDFHGLWLDDEATAAKKDIEDLCKPGSKAQVGIITMYKSKKYVVSLNKKAVTVGDSVSRHTVVRLTGEQAVIGGAEYDETDDGWWMKAAEGVKTNPGAAPKDLAPGEKWIDVNLRTQTLVAFEGDKPVFATAVSTGKEDKVDKEKDHHTPPGSFRIREKHIAATMDGDVASDGPYSIEDVPWIMYFNGSYALHGAFWHNNFGATKSHGCVNLAPTDAKALFGWTEPHLPDGWHGVMSTAEKPGTRVIVHE
jgi:lipoprotein-anchoring transpeptidase ErfK/SrfK